ncbi:hypothetical protein FOHLNKBM_1199 [Methylobacterium longum]|nr:hypothetical protein FOHLNKBM_1199 [Methylobacterium longum]
MIRRMNVWQLIAHDRAYLAHLIAESRYTFGGSAIDDREEVLGGLIDELAARAEALEATLYAPLRHLEPVPGRLRRVSGWRVVG